VVYSSETLKGEEDVKKLIVLGGGPGGNTAALTAARHGVEGVVLVEQGAMGGTCTNRGCIPTKFLLSRLERMGSSAAPDEKEWKKLVSHKNALVKGLSSSIEKSCGAAGVEIARGRGRLTGEHTVEVTGADGDTFVLKGEKIIIASGSSPAEIPGLALDGETILSSTEALNLARPPRSMVIVGSGAVGSEFAFIFHRAGTRVTIVEAMDRLFPGEDSEVHDLFTSRYAKMGVDFVTGDPVAGVEPGRRGEVKVHFRSGTILEADKVLVAAGRRLLTADIGLESAGIKRGPGGEIAVDEELRTSSPDIYAVGDVTGKLLLAHLASFQGAQAARAAAGKGGRPVPYHAVPWSIFTSPEIATVGVNETEAERREIEHTAALVPWMANIKARIDRKTEGFVKVVADGEGRIIGGTVVGEHASDMIHILSVAIHQGATAADLAGMVFAHPGLAETVYEAAQKLRHRLGSAS
jgi:dihydrolipoamide dehydrogenase